MDIARALFQVVIDLISLLFLLMCSRGKLAAETLFLRKQLAMYKERSIKPGRIDSVTKLTLLGLSRFFLLERRTGGRSAQDPHSVAP